MKTVFRIAALLFCFIFCKQTGLYAQSVGINTDGSDPDSRTILDVRSNTKGVLLPRMTNSERDELHKDVPEGMLIYNTTTHALQIFYDNTWYPITMGTGIPAFCVPVPVSINGPDTVYDNSPGCIYTTEAVSGATSYHWTVPAEAIITAGQGTTSITVTFGTVCGEVKVQAVNSCGSSDYLSFDVETLTLGSVVDFDGNIYTIKRIGTQVWMKENLKTTHYRDGSAIPFLSSNWQNLTTGVYNTTSYGSFYNWYAVTDSRHLCPGGWHIPSDNEWKTLEMYLGMIKTQADAEGENRGTNEGEKLKKYGNYVETNSSRFNGLLCGNNIYSDGQKGTWWSSTQGSTNLAWYRSVSSGSKKVCRSYENKYLGFTVRCLQD